MTSALTPFAGGWTFPPLNRKRLPWDESYPHYTAMELRRYLGARRFNRYFKFAFVRNPWERLVSRYFFLRAQNSNDPDARINERDYYPPGNLTFNDWLLRRGSGRNCIHPMDLRQQLEWLTATDGSLAVDFVGRFESLSNDFAEACRRIGLHPTLPHINTQTPPGEGGYRDLYTDGGRELVARVFRNDIERWQYDY